MAGSVKRGKVCESDGGVSMHVMKRRFPPVFIPSR